MNLKSEQNDLQCDSDSESLTLVYLLLLTILLKGGANTNGR